MAAMIASAGKKQTAKVMADLNQVPPNRPEEFGELAAKLKQGLAPKQEQPR